MTIEITKPEIESLIQQRLLTGAYSSPEDVILDALRSTAPTPVPANSGAADSYSNLSELLLNSPFAGSNLDLERIQDYPRTVEFE